MNKRRAARRSVFVVSAFGFLVAGMLSASLRATAHAGSDWGAPVVLADDAGDSGLSEPSTAVFEGNRILVVWERAPNQGGHELRYREHSPSGGWKPEAAVPTGEARSHLDPRLFGNGRDAAVLLWKTTGDEAFKLLGAAYSPSAGWTAAHVLDGGGVGTTDEPKAFVDDDGNAIIIWIVAKQIYSVQYDSDSGWGQPTVVNQDQKYAPVQAALVGDAGGGAMAVWLQYYAGGFAAGIWASRYEGSQGWSNPVLLNPNGTGDSGYPRIAASDSGHYYVIWKVSSGEERKVFSARYTPDTGWDSPVQLASLSSYASQTWSVRPPGLLVGRDGRALAMWIGSVDGDSKRRLQGYSSGAGGTWGEATTISLQDQTPDQFFLLWDSATSALALWSTGGKMAARGYDVQGGWGAASVVADYPPRAFDYAAASNKDGLVALAIRSVRDPYSTQETPTKVWAIVHQGGGSAVESPSASNPASPVKTGYFLIHGICSDGSLWGKEGADGFAVWGDLKRGGLPVRTISYRPAEFDAGAIGIPDAMARRVWNDAKEFIESEDLDDVVLVGHSLGGLLAKRALLMADLEERGSDILRVVTLDSPDLGITDEISKWLADIACHSPAHQDWREFVAQGYLGPEPDPEALWLTSLRTEMSARPQLAAKVFRMIFADCQTDQASGCKGLVYGNSADRRQSIVLSIIEEARASDAALVEDTLHLACSAGGQKASLSGTGVTDLEGYSKPLPATFYQGMHTKGLGYFQERISKLATDGVPGFLSVPGTRNCGAADGDGKTPADRGFLPSADFATILAAMACVLWFVHGRR